VSFIVFFSGTLSSTVYRWNGDVLLDVVRQLVELRHSTPVSHVGRYEDDLYGVQRQHSHEEHDDEDSQLVDAEVADNRVDVIFQHRSFFSEKKLKT